MKNHTYIALILSLFILAGCETEEETQQRFHNRCVKLGFKPKTDAFANCMMTTESNYYNALSGMVSSANQRIQENRPRTTRCTGYGSTLNCTTY